MIKFGYCRDDNNSLAVIYATVRMAASSSISKCSKLYAIK